MEDPREFFDNRAVRAAEVEKKAEQVASVTHAHS